MKLTNEAERLWRSALGEYLGKVFVDVTPDDVFDAWERFKADKVEELLTCRPTASELTEEDVHRWLYETWVWVNCQALEEVLLAPDSGYQSFHEVGPDGKLKQKWAPKEA